LACPMQNAAASARPIVRKWFIRTLLVWTVLAMLAQSGPE
jgi:hypothetical protein